MEDLEPGLISVLLEPFDKTVAHPHRLVAGAGVADAAVGDPVFDTKPKMLGFNLLDVQKNDGLPRSLPAKAILITILKPPDNKPPTPKMSVWPL